MNALCLRNADIYAPAPQGRGDILIINDKIVALEKDISLPVWLRSVREVDAGGLYAVPGFMDAHVHITGGGGEGGFASQVPPLPLSRILLSGVTTVGGLLGTDSVTRHVDAVLARACALEEEGISAFIISGGYPLPSPTLTGSFRTDMAFVEKVRGGKLALADHRTASVTAADIGRAAVDVRVGGMLRGMVGMLVLHMGAGSEGLSAVFAALDAAPYLARHLLATHINRSPAAFAHAVELVRRGGYMDVSSGLNAATLGPDTLKPSEAIASALRQGLCPERILMSSDGNGSAARYGEDGSVTGLVASDMRTLHREFADCVAEGMPLEQALAPVTSNVARAYSLYPRKGALAPGSDGDVLLLDRNLEIHSLVARGRLMLHEGTLLHKGTFEE